MRFHVYRFTTTQVWVFLKVFHQSIAFQDLSGIGHGSPAVLLEYLLSY